MNDIVVVEANSIATQTFSKELVEKFIKYLDFSPITIKTYENRLKVFLGYLATNNAALGRLVGRGTNPPLKSVSTLEPAEDRSHLPRSYCHEILLDIVSEERLSLECRCGDDINSALKKRRET